MGYSSGGCFPLLWIVSIQARYPSGPYPWTVLTLKKLLRRKYFREGCLYILPASILLGIGWESLQSSCVLKCMLKDRWCLLCIGKEVFQVPLSKGREQRTQPVSKDDCEGSMFNAGGPPLPSVSAKGSPSVTCF